jgi:hypothetical protein
LWRCTHRIGCQWRTRAGGGDSRQRNAVHRDGKAHQKLFDAVWSGT